MLGDVVYATSGKGIYAIDKDSGGVLLEQVRPGGNEELWSSLVASCRATQAEQETLLFCGNGGFGDGEGVFGLDLGLETVWSHDTDGPVWGSAAIAYGRVVIADNDGTVYCFVDDPYSEGMIAAETDDASREPLTCTGASTSGGIRGTVSGLGISFCPNPFSTATTLSLAIPKTEHSPVEVLVLDCSGRVVRALATSGGLTGRQALRWDGVAGDGSRVPTGVYFCRLRTGDMEVRTPVRVLR